MFTDALMQACISYNNTQHATASSQYRLGLYRIRLRPESGTFSKSGRNPAQAKIQPEPDSFAGFEKSIFGMLNAREHTDSYSGTESEPILK